MASNQTSNYGLNQWAATDKVLREEFNQDNAKIDTALAQEKAAREEAVAAEAQTRQAAIQGEQTARTAAIAALAATVPKIAVGTYTGNGAATQTISLGLTPKAVLMCTLEVRMYQSLSSGFVYGGLALTGAPAVKHHLKSVNDPYQDYTAIELVDSGFKAYETKIDNYAGVCCNSSGLVYHYFAVG